MPQKTAEGKAVGVWDAIPSSAQTAIDMRYRAKRASNPFGKGKDAWVYDLSMAFEEHARDQRHNCAEVLLGGPSRLSTNTAYALVMNAVAPGRGRQ